MHKNKQMPPLQGKIYSREKPVLLQEHLGASNSDDGAQSGDSRESFPERMVSEMQDEEAFARGKEERVVQQKEVRASRGGSKAGVMRNQPRQRSSQEAAEGPVCPTEEWILL